MFNVLFICSIFIIRIGREVSVKAKFHTNTKNCLERTSPVTLPCHFPVPVDLSAYSLVDFIISGGSYSAAGWQSGQHFQKGKNHSGLIRVCTHSHPHRLRRVLRQPATTYVPVSHAAISEYKLTVLRDRWDDRLQQ